MEKRRRRDIIREVMESHPPASQRELVERLTARGIKADQSTISRDLREMGVVRLPGKDGRPVYGFAGEHAGPLAADELRRGARDFITGVESSGNLVILRTAPGNAQAMAAILDRTQMDEVAGTVAGDDTILVVVREGYKAGDVEKWFEELAG
ncbi:MAG: arginine repressor [Actinobacteria bacterium]|jgi:transcriptional regulator of arginine metabolism|nr:MAG: arginine repressor [Actinomycetota bacterium]